LLDTLVWIDILAFRPADLPDELAISSISLAELTAGPHATRDPNKRAARQHLVQRIEATVETIPFNVASAQAYGQIYSATLAQGRRPRGRRAYDLLIAATALAHGLPLYTQNPSDFEYPGLLEIVTL
jgi:predicted nucleic acid-binding protein